MEEQQNVNPQPRRLARLTTTWHALDKKKWATLGGVVLTLGALVITGVRKGIPWVMAQKQ